MHLREQISAENCQNKQMLCRAYSNIGYFLNLIIKNVY